MRPVRKPRLLLPNDNVDLSAWAVVACDQYTSEPEYWDSLRRYVGDKPSTLDLIFPEAYIGKKDLDAELDTISQNMRRYVDQGILRPYDGYILVERTLSNGDTRVGLIAEIDLECYDPFGKLDVRATEKTVKERLPLRMRIRRDAILESPHIMVLLDDPKRQVIEKLSQNKKEPLYSFELNMNGGFLKGYALNTDVVEAALDQFVSTRTPDQAPFYLAVGDGNHSLAAARECWLEIKKGLSEQEICSHPSRYALVEIVNLFEPSLVFEPIYRVVFGADESFLKNFPSTVEGENVELLVKGQTTTVKIKGDSAEIIAVIQSYIDEYLTKHEGAYQDYIHGIDNLKAVAKDGIGIIMPSIDKNTMFNYIDHNGVLTRKSFSMGLASDKRYYFESRMIK